MPGSAGAPRGGGRSSHSAGCPPVGTGAHPGHAEPSLRPSRVCPISSLYRGGLSGSGLLPVAEVTQYLKEAGFEPLPFARPRCLRSGQHLTRCQEDRPKPLPAQVPPASGQGNSVRRLPRAGRAHPSTGLRATCFRCGSIRPTPQPAPRDAETQGASSPGAGGRGRRERPPEDTGGGFSSHGSGEASGWFSFWTPPGGEGASQHSLPWP